VEPPPVTTEVRLLRQRIAQLETEKLELYKQREELARVKAELSLADLARGLARAATAGEASAPDRAVRSLAASVQGHFIFELDGVGIRFQPPELGHSTAGLGRVAFELAKVPPPLAAAAPTNITSVLQEKQALYSDERWRRKAEGARVVSEITRVLGVTPTAGELAAASASIASHERRMALSFRAGEGQAYRTATRSLVWLVNALVTKPEASASDLLALSATLAATTVAARELLR
jgi:hypothetical protein